jgi:hypothetical protein
MLEGSWKAEDLKFAWEHGSSSYALPGKHKALSSISSTAGGKKGSWKKKTPCTKRNKSDNLNKLLTKNTKARRQQCNMG